MDLALFDQKLKGAPPAHHADDVWARLCCEQAQLSNAEGSYAVGAVLISDSQELLSYGRNTVFGRGFQSGRHAEMEVIDRMERDYPGLDKSGMTLFVSLEPCLMCFGRILLAGIGRVRYLSEDPVGGFTRGVHFLPPVWAELSHRTSFEQADVSDYWKELAQDLVEENAGDMREKVAAAWKGHNSGL